MFMLHSFISTTKEIQLTEKFVPLAKQRIKYVFYFEQSICARF